MTEEFLKQVSKTADLKIINDRNENGHLHAIDVTWKDLSSLNGIHASLSFLIEILRLMWCDNDEHREKDLRIGSIKMKFDNDGSLHFDFCSRFSFSKEQQEKVQELMSVILEEIRLEKK